MHLGALTALSGSHSKWAAQRDECLVNISSWARQWTCAALVHARCAREVPLAEPAKMRVRPLALQFQNRWASTWQQALQGAKRNSVLFAGSHVLEFVLLIALA